MIKIKNNILKDIILFIIVPTIIFTLLFVIAFIYLKNNEKNTHKYIATNVTEKYINEGYAGIYVYKDTEYVIVSTYKELNETHTITTIVDISTYNSINIGDTINYCVNHNKLEIYEK